MSDKLPDLRTYIDHVIDVDKVVDVADIAHKVRSIVPAEVLEAHMLAFLRLAVRDRMAERRAANRVIRGAAAETNHQRAVAAPVSTKVARRREQFAAARARWLADAVWTGDRRVMLGDATAADLIAAAQHARTVAARNVATAERYEQIAALPEMQRDGATVGSLPDAVLQQLIDRP